MCIAEYTSVYQDNVSYLQVRSTLVKWRVCALTQSCKSTKILMTLTYKMTKPRSFDLSSCSAAGRGGNRGTLPWATDVLSSSEHVKSQNFLGACPQTPLSQSIVWAQLFVFALGPNNPLWPWVAASQKRAWIWSTGMQCMHYTWCGQISIILSLRVIWTSIKITLAQPCSSIHSSFPALFTCCHFTEHWAN